MSEALSAAPRKAPRASTPGCNGGLPHGVLEATLASDPSPRVFAVIASVCRDWHAAAAAARHQLAVALRSDGGTASLRKWLSAHGWRLRELEIETAGLFSRHCSLEARLGLLAALINSGSSTLTSGRGLQLERLSITARLTAAECSEISRLPARTLRSLILRGSPTTNTHRVANALFCGDIRGCFLEHLTCLKLEQLGMDDVFCNCQLPAVEGLLDLSLCGNLLKDDHMHGVARLARLTALDVSRNRLGDAGLAILCSKLPNLASLNASCNYKFTAAGLKELSSLTALRCLSLAHCSLCTAGLSTVAASAPPGLLSLDIGGNRIARLDGSLAAGLPCLTRLVLSRNPLGMAALRCLPALQSLAHLELYQAARHHQGSITCLAALHPSLTSLLLGCDPALLKPGNDVQQQLPLSKPRTAEALFAALGAPGAALASLELPCAGLGGAAAAAALPRLGDCLTALNLSYNAISADALAAALPPLRLLRRLELRAMVPELEDAAAAAVSAAAPRLTLLDLAYNDVGNDGVAELSRLSALRSLSLRANAQVEKASLLAAAATGAWAGLTYLDVQELSDVSARRGPPGAPPHADMWAALPALRSLLLSPAGRSGSGSALAGGRIVLAGGE